MSKPQVTITLGRSGQKVVKNSWSASRADCQVISRRKRSLSDRFEKDADTSMSSSGKRLQKMDYPRSSGSTIVKGVRVGQNDLRLKLVHKRTSRQVKHDVQEHTKTEIRQNTSSTIRDPKGTKQTSMPHHQCQEESEDYQIVMFWALLCQLAQCLCRGELPLMLTSHQQGLYQYQKLLVSALYCTMTKFITNLGEQSLTVSSLLNSLGLGKYAINFLAEEVDMTILEQMQDQVLKALGLPMGPRKKILLAIMPRPKRQQQLQV